MEREPFEAQPDVVRLIHVFGVRLETPSAHLKLVAAERQVTLPDGKRAVVGVYETDEERLGEVEDDGDVRRQRTNCLADGLDHIASGDALLAVEPGHRRVGGEQCRLLEHGRRGVDDRGHLRRALQVVTRPSHAAGRGRCRRALLLHTRARRRSSLWTSG